MLDGTLGEIYGIYDFGNGLMETARFPITQAQIATISGMGVAVDYRVGANHIEFDNFVVSSVPVPATAWLLGSALLGLARCKRRRTPELGSSI